MTNLDWENREADCSRCGRVTFKKNGATVRCTRKLSRDHRITDISVDAMTGYCRGCHRRVDLYRASSGSLACKIKKSEVDRLTKSRVDPEERRAYHRAWREANRERLRAYQRRKTYGLTEGEYETLLLFQGNRCAICWRPPAIPRDRGGILHLDHDHDHATLANRALLCADCNRMLGLAEDDISRLRNAIEYLSAHR